MSESKVVPPKPAVAVKPVTTPPKPVVVEPEVVEPEVVEPEVVEPKVVEPKVVEPEVVEPEVVEPEEVEPEDYAKVVRVKNNTDKIICTSQGCIAINGKGKATIAELMLHAGFLERV